MLAITMKTGEYFVVDENTVVQFIGLDGQRIHLNITAPREVAILRGEVLEKRGGSRPACIVNAPAPFVSRLPWNKEKKEALADLHAALKTMEDSEELRRIREDLRRIFPNRDFESDGQ